jgi:hypothetical protein
MRTIASLALWAFCSLVLFIVGVLATFQANVLIYGTEKFNGDVPASVGVLMQGILVGVFFGLFGTRLAIYLSDRIPWLRDSD